MRDICPSKSADRQREQKILFIAYARKYPNIVLLILHVDIMPSATVMLTKCYPDFRQHDEMNC